jgi:hypothetical protein
MNIDHYPYFIIDKKLKNLILHKLNKIVYYSYYNLAKKQYYSSKTQLKCTRLCIANVPEL